MYGIHKFLFWLMIVVWVLMMPFLSGCQNVLQAMGQSREQVIDEIVNRKIDLVVFQTDYDDMMRDYYMGNVDFRQVEKLAMRIDKLKNEIARLEAKEQSLSSSFDKVIS